MEKEKCSGSCCCCKPCGKLMSLAGIGLMLWGVGYGINGLVHMVNWWGVYPGWLLIKFFLFRLGLSFAAILFAGKVMGCNKGTCCCPGSCCNSGGQTAKS